MVEQDWVIEPDLSGAAPFLAAAMVTAAVGTAAPSPKPNATDTACTTEVATVIPTSTGTAG